MYIKHENFPCDAVYGSEASTAELYHENVRPLVGKAAAGAGWRMQQTCTERGRAHDGRVRGQMWVDMWEMSIRRGSAQQGVALREGFRACTFQSKVARGSLAAWSLSPMPSLSPCHP